MMANNSVLRILIPVLFIACMSCKDLYKAGGLTALGYPIDTNLRGAIIQAYLDTLIQYDGYHAPEKWDHRHKMDDRDSVNNKRVYFKSDPEEMYIISFMGEVVLLDVYNPSIDKLDWVSDPKLVSLKEQQRMEKRIFQLLDLIRERAQRAGIPDSVIYKHAGIKD
jgi:hypothetical protein